MTNEIITLIANVALALSFIVALIFGIAQVRTSARDRLERLTLETLRTFQTREFAELGLFINSRELPPTYEGMQALPVNEQIFLFQLAQQMESLGLLVAKNLISIDLVDKILGSFVTSSWDKYKTMFQDIRVKNSDPFLGEYFQWLSERIDARMRDNPRRPAFETK
jgi:hypothetical protein